MGQAVLSQYDYINLIVERYGTGRDLERFSDKFPKEKETSMKWYISDSNPGLFNLTIWENE